MNQTTSTFDEQRVLDELEQLQHAIRATRERRERAQADFDVQLSAFALAPASHLKPAILPSVGPPAAVRPENQVGATVPADTVPSTRVPPEPQRAVLRMDIAPVMTLPPADASPGAPRSRAARLVATGVVALLLTSALGWGILRSRSEPGATPAAATPPPAAAARPVPQPAAPPVDPHPLRIDIATSRPVWMRVVVDGRIAIERSLPAGERLPFGADKSIVLRAGDAGAVTVRVGTVDQGVLGRDGQPITRTFELPKH